MTVLPEGGDVYSVTTESGSEYRVDDREGRCTCPDYKHNLAGGRCKHIRRVRFATGQQPIPAWCDTDAVDSHLGEHVAATPQVVADGGIIEAGDEGEILDEDARPNDCDCGAWNNGERVDLPCWPCYRDGFDAPNPADPGADE